MPESPPERMLVISRERFILDLHVWNDEHQKYRRARRYRIAVGGIGYETPAGPHVVIGRDKDPEWTAPDSAWVIDDLRGQTIAYGNPNNPIKGRWIGLTKDGVGIHGTDNLESLGTAASHGCIRMDVPDVVDLFDRVPVGTPVVIA